MKKCYIFDLDGTLRITKSGRPCPNNIEDQDLLPGVKEKLQGLVDNSCFLFSASNQGGVSFGYMCERQAQNITSRTNELLGNTITGMHHAFFHPGGRYNYRYKDIRKPKPDMINSVLRGDHFQEFDKGEAIFIGNAYSDRDCARNAGVDFEWAHDFFAWKKDFVVENEHGFQPAEWLKKWEALKIESWG